MEAIKKQIRLNMMNDEFTQHNGIRLISVEKDKVVVGLMIKPESCNHYGTVHGGAIYSLADDAAGTAADLDGRCYVTQTSAMHFLRNQGTGEVLATGTVRHRGRKTCLIAVDITGENDKLIATGEFTFFCLDSK